MKLSVDKKAGALYLRLDDSPVVESEEVSPGVVRIEPYTVPCSSLCGGRPE